MTEAVPSPMKPFEIVILTPPELPDPSMAIAASRAGALGVLNLEFLRDPEGAKSAISAMSRHARRETGAKLSGASGDLIRRLTPELPASVHSVILTAGDERSLPESIDLLRRSGRSVWLAATSRELASPV